MSLSLSQFPKPFLYPVNGILLNYDRLLSSGVMHPDSGCGCHAGDHESYEMYKELFHPVIEMYHKGFKIASDRYERGS